MKNLINNMLSHFGVRLTYLASFDDLLEKGRAHQIISLLQEVESENLAPIIENIEFSKSQFGQDLFCLSELGFPKDGYFVEFGATGGIEGSNSYLLEKKFGWKGILAEPAKIWHDELMSNRAVHIETSCVWSKSNEKIMFDEVQTKGKASAGLSTISSFSSKKWFDIIRTKKLKYIVNTVSLEDLLLKYNAPNVIDYLSIDTEGSEFEILSAFNFEKYQIRVITCEHNYSSTREKIFNLLKSKGYIRKFENISGVDDWYVLTGK